MNEMAMTMFFQGTFAKILHRAKGAGQRAQSAETKGLRDGVTEREQLSTFDL